MPDINRKQSPAAPSSIRTLLFIPVTSFNDRQLGIARGLESDQTDWQVSCRLIRTAGKFYSVSGQLGHAESGRVHPWPAVSIKDSGNSAVVDHRHFDRFGDYSRGSRKDR